MNDPIARALHDCLIESVATEEHANVADGLLEIARALERGSVALERIVVLIEKAAKAEGLAV